MFSKEKILRPSFSALETSNQLLSEQQAGHLKWRYISTVVIEVTALSQIFISFFSNKNVHIHWVPSTEELYCELMSLKVHLLGYLKYLCNRIVAGLPKLPHLGWSPLSKYNQLEFSGCILYLAFNVAFQPYWIIGDALCHSGLLKRDDLKVTGKVTMFSYTINEHFVYNLNNILINVITTQAERTWMSVLYAD